VDITIQRVAARYDYLCKCDKGTAITTVPLLYRTMFLRGLGREFPDDKQLQDDILIMNEVEKGACR